MAASGETGFSFVGTSDFALGDFIYLVSVVVEVLSFSTSHDKLLFAYVILIVQLEFAYCQCIPYFCVLARLSIESD